jgi:hypothetical protein
MDQVSVELSELECASAVLVLPSTTTVTFFDGDAPTAVLKERLASIIRANPWLTGRLVKGKPRVRLVWDAPAADTETLLAPYYDELPPTKCSVHRGITYEAIINAIKKHKGVTAKRSIACIGKDEPLMRVVVFPGEGSSFALLVSIAHAIADGFTYYQVYNMLSPAVPIHSMEPTRKEHFGDALKKAMGDEQYSFETSNGYLLNYMRSRFFGSKMRVRAFLLDPVAVEAAKAKAKEGSKASFVSTNDVITSSYIKAAGARVCEMAINFRNRLEGITDSDAGNYEGGIFYSPEDAAHPALIRRSIETFRGAAAPPVLLPTGFKRLVSRNAIITNWTTFIRELSFSGCTQQLHLPIYAVSEVGFEVCIIFRPRPGETAVLLFSRVLDDEKIVNMPGGILGDPVAPEMFP